MRTHRVLGRGPWLWNLRGRGRTERWGMGRSRQQTIPNGCRSWSQKEEGVMSRGQTSLAVGLLVLRRRDTQLMEEWG